MSLLARNSRGMVDREILPTSETNPWRLSFIFPLHFSSVLQLHHLLRDPSLGSRIEHLPETSRY